MPYSIPNVEHRPAQLGRRAGERDFDTGHGLEKIAREVGETGDLAMRLFEQEMDSRVVGALSNATRAMTNLGLEVESEPDHNKRMGMYTKGSQKISEEFRKGIQYPRYQEAFDERFFQQTESMRIDVLNNVRNARIASAQATLLMSVETQLDAAKNQADPVRRDEIYREAVVDIDAAVKSGTLGEVQAAQMKIQVANAAETERLIFDTYALADAIYDQYPDHEKRREAIREVPAHLREQVSRIVEGRYRREQDHEKEANDAQYIDIQKRAMAGMTMEELADEELRLRDTEMPLSQGQFTALANTIQERANKGKTLEGKALEATTYDALVDLARDPMTRTEFLKLNLRVDFGHILSEDFIKTLERDQAKGASDLDDSSISEISMALASMGLPVTASDFGAKGVDEEVMRRSMLFRQMAEAALRRAEHIKRQPLTREETSNVVQSMKDEVVRRERNWPRSDETSRLFEMTTAQFATPTLQVPAEIEDRIRREMGLGDRDDVVALGYIRDIYAQLLLTRQQGSAPLTSLSTPTSRAVTEEDWRAVIRARNMGGLR